MSIFDLFSKRQARARGEQADVYVYDRLPLKLRVQLVHVFQDLLNGGDDFNLRRNTVLRAYRTIHDVLSREYGLFRLSENKYSEVRAADDLFNFFLNAKSVEQAFDVVELVARYADGVTRSSDYLEEYAPGPAARVDGGLAELNARLLEHGVGFQYEGGKLVRLDSDLLHSEAVKPALTLLRAKGFEGPRDEFLGAHEHFRHGRHEEALTEANKAFESTMKSICDLKGWSYDKNAPASKLIDVCLKSGLIDGFWQTELSGLRMTLEAGIATARNKLGGHGQGAKVRTVPQSIVAYVLHMTASTIVFLIESAK